MVNDYHPYIKFQEFISKRTDYSHLPSDCPARAAQRMRKCYHERRPCDPKDVFIVLGDPTKGIELPPDPKENLEKFLEMIHSKIFKT